MRRIKITRNRQGQKADGEGHMLHNVTNGKCRGTKCDRSIVFFKRKTAIFVSMKNILKDSGIIALMTAFVLSFLQPFGIEQMTGKRMYFIVFVSVLAFAVSVLSYSIARGITHRHATKVKDIIVFHAVNIPIASAAILTSISWFSWGNLHSAWYCTQGEFSVINYLIVCLQVALMSVFIFVMQLYRTKNRNLQAELETMKAINAHLEQRLEDIATPKESGTPQQNTITLTGNTNTAVLEVCVEEIIYIESMQNYANIRLLHDGDVCNKTLRITMKQLRQSLDSFGCLFACHRAFIVNMDYIQSVSGRRSSGYKLQMFGTDKQIPISRTNSDEFERRMGVNQTFYN
ncbi:MAG: LytTR family transcriptional regulator [Bacteroidaceae bacterium]|nr:LytTR family transcriptional regulator [Bacteroidaceae bacterium]